MVSKGAKKSPKQESNGQLTEDNRSTENTGKADKAAGQQPVTNDRSTSTQSNGSLRSPPTVKRSTWYGGSWRSKASPVAQVAKESVCVSQGATSESPEGASRPSKSLSNSVRGNRKSVPLAAEASKIHATSDGSNHAQTQMPSEKWSSPDGAEAAGTIASESRKSLRRSTELDRIGRPESGPWFGWWSRESDQDGPTGPTPGRSPGLSRDMSPSKRVNSSMPAQSGRLSSDADAIMAGEPEGTAAPEAIQQESQDRSSISSKAPWFGLWGSSQKQPSSSVVPHNKAQACPPEVTAPEEPPSQPVAPHSNDRAMDLDGQPQAKAKSSGWAFWSYDQPKDPKLASPSGQTQVGELAVSDTPSQSQPEAAQFQDRPGDQISESKADSKLPGSLFKSRRDKTGKPKPSNDASETTTSTKTEANRPSSEVPTPNAPIPKAAARQTSTASSQNRAQPPQRPNLISPSFKDTIPRAPNPGYVGRVTQYLTHTLYSGAPHPAAPRHVFVTRPSRKIKRAVALGIHGFFPTPLFQRILGPPTGTSVRFANYAAVSIQSWCHQHQPHVKDVRVEKVALEGEGYVADRVSTLWKLLLNWLSHLQQADFVLVACHSQGVPVAIMLLAKLTQLGCLSAHVRIGVCAMAGINLGPFTEYKSRFFSGNALELFDFCDSKTRVSRAYAEALEECLRHGVRITYVGSLDDQVVSLDSSLHTPLSHPYVTRAVFVDGRLHAPNFLTHLVIFALKLRNLGLSDHGLLRELSAPLAGSLVAGEGHSRIYDDPAVYRLAVEFAMESTDVVPMPESSEKGKDKADGPPHRASQSESPRSPALSNLTFRGTFSVNAPPGIAPTISAYEPSTGANAANPFVLPWAVRGMLDEDIVKRDPRLREEVGVLVREFDEWLPSSKVLKDVRWRLEGVRSLL